jgi:hypothetical protein
MKSLGDMVRKSAQRRKLIFFYIVCLRADGLMK